MQLTPSIRKTRRAAVKLLALPFAMAGILPLAAQEPGCEVVDNALREHHKLKAGLKRRDVEKSFEPASLGFRGTTTYTFRRCHTVHIQVTFSLDENVKADFSPDDVIVSVTPPYLQEPTAD